MRPRIPTYIASAAALAVALTAAVATTAEAQRIRFSTTTDGSGAPCQAGDPLGYGVHMAFSSCQPGRTRCPAALGSSRAAARGRGSECGTR